MGSGHRTEHREETISDGLGQITEHVRFPATRAANVSRFPRAPDTTGLFMTG